MHAEPVAPWSRFDSENIAVVASLSLIDTDPVVNWLYGLAPGFVAVALNTAYDATPATPATRSTRIALSASLLLSWRRWSSRQWPFGACRRIHRGAPLAPTGISGHVRSPMATPFPGWARDPRPVPLAAALLAALSPAPLLWVRGRTCPQQLSARPGGRCHTGCTTNPQATPKSQARRAPVHGPRTARGCCHWLRWGGGAGDHRCLVERFVASATRDGRRRGGRAGVARVRGHLVLRGVRPGGVTALRAAPRRHAAARGGQRHPQHLAERARRPRSSRCRPRGAPSRQVPDRSGREPCAPRRAVPPALHPHGR